MKLKNIFAATLLATSALAGTSAQAANVNGGISFIGGFPIPAALTDLPGSMVSTLTSFNVDPFAVGVGANGDLAPAAVRQVVGPEALVGLSTHNTEQLTAAVQEPVQYVAIGPVFGTATKDTGYTPVGLDAVRRAAAIAGDAHVPVVAIGGITVDRASDVLQAGATAVAVISDILVGNDPAGRVRAFLERLARV